MYVKSKDEYTRRKREKLFKEEEKEDFQEKEEQSSTKVEEVDFAVNRMIDRISVRVR